MTVVLCLLIALGFGYGAYRAFRGGFEKPQSNKLTGYGYIGIGLLLIWLVSLIDRLFF